MDPPPHPGQAHLRWYPLAEASASPRRFGNKAARLAELLASGLPVLDGWVLPVDAVARIGEDIPLKETFARSLLEAGRHAWILRSSSPLEDRPESSAAGLFRSETVDPTIESIAAGLATVAHGARREEVRRLLVADDIGLAVLAQPHRAFDLWLTVEIDRGTDPVGIRSEGWRWTARTATAVRAERAETGDAAIDRLHRLALRAARSTDDPRLLLELGLDPEGAWLLQLRTISATTSTFAARAPTSDAAPPELIGLGARVHEGDEASEWVWDREHSPTALCPLLASIFGRWLAVGPASYPSRLIDGRWHDRVIEDAPLPTEDQVRDQLERWRREDLPSLGLRVGALARAAERLERSPADWSDFVSGWLSLQTDYFERRPGSARRWARAVFERLEANGRRPPPIGATDTRRREHEWDFLAARIELTTPAPARTAEALEAWTREHAGHDLTQELRAALTEVAHFSAMPYDGRGRTWGENPAPFWREITRRRASTTGVLGGGNEDPATGDDTEAELAAWVLTEAENDNDLLLRAYAAFRSAVRSLGRRIAPDRPWEDLLDVLADDLEALIRPPEDPARWDLALARGRALRARWESPPDPGGAPSLSGRTASPGRALGPIWRGRTLEDLEELDESPIAVVPTVTPLDSIHFHRLAGLVCEGGDVLGHASVLAREHGLPCVVGVAAARAQLAFARVLLLDADAGRVEIVE